MSRADRPGQPSKIEQLHVQESNEDPDRLQRHWACPNSVFVHMFGQYHFEYRTFVRYSGARKCLVAIGGRTLGKAPTQGLTVRQQQILDYLVQEVQDKGYAPSVREIGDALGLKSPSTVHQHLVALEQKGCIRRHGERMRALEVVDKALIQTGESVPLPLVGRVSAGAPTLADEQVEDHIEVPRRLCGDPRGCFLLRVRGDSMIGAGIMPEDLVIVRKQATARAGDIVVAQLEEEATVKTLALEEEKPLLLPANPEYQPIRGEFQIAGRVIALIRAYEGVHG